MKKLIISGTALLALGVAASAAVPGTAAADDTINRVNDSVIKTQQMDYLTRHGGYVIYQDTYSDAVGGRNATIVEPAQRGYLTTPSQVNTYVVTPPAGYVAPSSGYQVHY